jgi:hypothetical protein
MSLTDEEIKALIEEKTETPNRDYKETLIWNRDNRDEYLDVIKDILAMANTQDGGKIIFGVKDGSFDFVGLSEESFNSFDVTPINQCLHNYADPTFTCNVIKRTVDGKKVVVIDIPEFENDPIVCKELGQSSKNKEILSKGGVYIRTKKCTSELVSNADEMRSILERGINKKSDEILAKISRLMRANQKKGIHSPLTEQTPATPPVVKNEYPTEIKEAREFFDGKLDSKLGYWEVIAYPTEYKPDRITNPVQANELIDQASVHLRGWNFPHNDIHGNSTNFAKGRQSVSAEKDWHQEAWRMYKSGLFAWRESYMEDIKGYTDDGKKVISFVNIIYSITEYMLFLKRVYAEKIKTEQLYFSISLTDCEGRKLASLYPGVHIWNYVSNEKVIPIEKTVDSVELQASANEIARDVIKEIFMLFNWNDPADSMIEDWQKKLIEKGGM